MAALEDIRIEDLNAVCENWGKKIWYGSKSGKGIKESAQSFLGGLALRAGIQLTEYSSEDANRLIPMMTGHLLCEFFLRKRSHYSNNITGAIFGSELVGTSPLEYLDRFFEKICLDFENECREAWRLEPGTFSYVYRNCQINLRENLPNFNWSLYSLGKKGSAYGPSGLNEDILIMNEYNSEELIGIPLMPDAPAEKSLFKGEELPSLAIYLYSQIYAIRFPQQTADAKLLLRNFVYWLCNKYQLLNPTWIWPSAEDNDGEKETPPLKDREEIEAENCPSPSLSLAEEREDEIRLLAEEAAASMGKELRRLFRSKYVDELSDEDCAKCLKLGGGTTVRRHLRRLQIFLRDEILKSPLLTGVPGSDSFSSRPSTLCSELFISFLGDLTKDESYD